MMTTNKLVVCIMGGNHQEELKICLDSVQDADAVVYCDGMSKDDSQLVARGLGAEVIEREHEPDNPRWNGEQRNFYLQHLQENYMDWWCLCLDADEVVDDLSKLRGFIEEANKNLLYSVHMRHFIGHFGQEDALKEKHYVPNRLFHVQHGLTYPPGEHVVLERTGCTHGDVCTDITIWHLSYSQLFYLRERYEHHKKTSNIHSQEFLDSWYRAHIFGKYPVKPVDPKEIPHTILDAFHIPQDELYFAGRGLETKHFIDAASWKEHFHPNSVLEWGSGLGPRVKAMRLLGMDAWGVELSKWAVEHTLAEGYVSLGDILKQMPISKKHDLVVAYDILEHVEEASLPLAIKKLKECTKRSILVSVPFVGDPNLTADPTHKIFKERDWWVEQFVKQGLEERPIPNHFQFGHQLMIFVLVEE